MSYCKTFGKDKVMFVTKEDHAIPSNIKLPAPEPAQTLITNDGNINWSCPCLGGMATGPCGVQFRDAFSCFHYSTAEPKGSDCYAAFRTMQDCFGEYPTVYNKTGGAEDHDLNSEPDIMDSSEKMNDVTSLGAVNFDKESADLNINPDAVVVSDTPKEVIKESTPKEVVQDSKEIEKVAKE